MPEAGFFEGVRRICDESGTLLIVDETHTFSAGPGGATRRFDLRPDALTIGKSLGGGVPCGAYGLSEELAARVHSSLADGADIVDVGGVGGTLAGNAMSFAAMRAVLGEVLTDESFGPMEVLATTFAQGVARVDREPRSALVGELSWARDASTDSWRRPHATAASRPPARMRCSRTIYTSTGSIGGY